MVYIETNTNPHISIFIVYANSCASISCTLKFTHSIVVIVNLCQLISSFDQRVFSLSIFFHSVNRTLAIWFLLLIDSPIFFSFFKHAKPILYCERRSWRFWFAFKSYNLPTLLCCNCICSCCFCLPAISFSWHQDYKWPWNIHGGQCFEFRSFFLFFNIGSCLCWPNIGNQTNVQSL